MNSVVGGYGIVRATVCQPLTHRPPLPALFSMMSIMLSMDGFRRLQAICMIVRETMLLCGLYLSAPRRMCEHSRP